VELNQKFILNKLSFVLSSHFVFLSIHKVPLLFCFSWFWRS